MWMRSRLNEWKDFGTIADRRKNHEAMRLAEKKADADVLLGIPVDKAKQKRRENVQKCIVGCVFKNVHAAASCIVGIKPHIAACPFKEKREGDQSCRRDA